MLADLEKTPAPTPDSILDPSVKAEVPMYIRADGKIKVHTTFDGLHVKSIVRAGELNRSGTIFYKIVQLLAYADDIDIIGLNNRAVSSAFSKLDKEAKRMGLVVNEGKTKYLLSSNKQSAHSRIGTHVTVDSYNFEVVKDFVYLVMSALKSNVESLLPTSATSD